MNLGSVLRNKRKEKKLTLKAVSERAGISEGFLSQVENNVNSPSVETLIHICSAMDIEAGDVLNMVKKHEPLVVVRKDEWNDADLPDSGFVTRRFFPPENRRVIDTAVLVLDPGKSLPVRKNIKNAQEVLCVLKGKIDLVHADTMISLSEGDSVHYWSNPEKQAVINNAPIRAVVLWVGTL